jgi:HEPN domain-containing protein
MTPKRLPPHDPREWLNRAHGNLVRAESRIPGAYLEDLCFDAQQAAEKGIKAVYVCRRESFQFIHDLDQLLETLERNGLKVPKYVRQAKKLSLFAVMTRYPDKVRPVTERRYHGAVRIASAVLRWAERQVALGMKRAKGKK